MYITLNETLIRIFISKELGVEIVIDLIHDYSQE